MIVKDPKSQYQIGDQVVLLCEGVYATVEGYFWDQTIGEYPKIVGYKLSCGVTVSGNMIAPRAHLDAEA